MCYAYRDREKEEDLVEHLISTANCCFSRWELNALASKISRALKIDLDRARDSIVLASMLHDIGKAAEVYQEKCLTGECTSFQGHYLISAFIVHLAFNLSSIELWLDEVKKFLGDNINELDKNKVLSILVILPIALHHYHQIRGFGSLKAESNTVSEFLENPTINKTCLEKIRNLLSYNNMGQEERKLVGKIYSVLADVDRYIDEDVYRSSKMFIQNFYSDIIVEGLKNYSITLGKTVIEAIYGLINLCDGYVASIKR